MVSVFPRRGWNVHEVVDAGHRPIRRNDADRQDRLPRAKELSSAGPARGPARARRVRLQLGRGASQLRSRSFETGWRRTSRSSAAPTRANADLLRKELGLLADAVDWHPERHSLSSGSPSSSATRRPCSPAGRGGSGCSASRPGPRPRPHRLRPNGNASSRTSTLRSPSTRSGSCVRTRRRLPEGIVTEAHRTHPVIGCSEAGTPEPRVSRSRGVRPRARPGASPGAAARSCGARLLGAVRSRSFVANRAEAAGLGPEAVQDLKLAAGEVGANVFRATRTESRACGPGSLTTHWSARCAMAGRGSTTRSRATSSQVAGRRAVGGSRSRGGSAMPLRSGRARPGRASACT